jgi:two-component system response regulator PilR (NtrC family)
LQEQEFRRVGGTRNLQVDVRLIAASNKDLEQEVAAEHFREDLFYRLNVIRVTLPPLRERREDIPLLVEHFLRKLTGQQDAHVSESLLRRLLDYQWPGNIRELENTIERCVVLGSGGELDEDSLPTHIRSQAQIGSGGLEEIPDEGLDLDAYLGNIEKDILLKALDKVGGVRKRAAELLGISFRSIRYRLAKFGIDADGEED